MLPLWHEHNRYREGLSVEAWEDSSAEGWEEAGSMEEWLIADQLLPVEPQLLQL